MKYSSRSLKMGAGILVLGVGAAILSAYSPNLETSLPKDVSHAQQWYGNSVAVDDRWAAVGAPGELSDPADPGSAVVGAVHVYRRGSAGWELRTKVFPPTSAAATQFGASVALSGDTLVVGAYLANAPAQASGAVYIYALDDAGATLTTTVTPSDSHGSQNFGFPVKMQGDRIIVGALGDNETLMFSGAAYVLHRESGTWVVEGKLKSPFPSWDEYFGWWVDVDGTTAVVGAPYGAAYLADGSFIERAGSAYVFDLSAGVWSHVATLNSSAPRSDAHLGWSVAIHGDAVVAGIPFGGTEFGGAVEVFRRGPGGWVSEALLEADDAEIGAQLGYDVDVRGDTVAAGAVADGNVGGVMVPGGGSVYMFERSGGVWNLTTEVAAAGRMPGESGGYAVAYDGRSLAVGAPRQVPAGCSGSCSEFGAAYVFEQNQAPIADASGTPTQVDSANGVDAEVVLDGSASSDPDGDPLSFAWYEGSQLLGQTAMLPVTLGVGSHTIELRVSDGRADATVSVVVEVVPANQPPVASVAASTIQVIADGPDGALVQLDGSSSSDPDGDALTFGWFEGDVALASGAVAAVRLRVGLHSVRLEVSDGQATSTAEVNVEVAPAAEANHAPIADASRTSQRVIAGDNRHAAVRLNGSLSSDPDGDELSYQWFRGDELLAEGIFARVTLPVGTHVIRLSVSDGSLSGETEVVVRVLTPAQAVRSLALKVENADLPQRCKTMSLALLKNAERSFESDRMLLGSHQLCVFQRLLEKSSKNRAVIRPLVKEAQAIIDAVRRG